MKTFDYLITNRKTTSGKTGQITFSGSDIKPALNFSGITLSFVDLEFIAAKTRTNNWFNPNEGSVSVTLGSQVIWTYNQIIPNPEDWGKIDEVPRSSVLHFDIPSNYVNADGGLTNNIVIDLWCGASNASTYWGVYDVYMHYNFEPNTYTVSFNSNINEASLNTTSKTVTFDSTYGTLPTPTKSGFVFQGWYTAAVGGTEITSNTTVSITNNHTLYAHWTAIPDINYENLFSLSGWMNSTSSPLKANVGNCNVELDNVNGTIKIIDNPGGATDSYTPMSGTGIYTIPVVKGVEYIFKYTVETNGTARPLVFATNDALNGYTGVLIDASSTQSGIHEHTFTPTTNNIHFRFGTDKTDNIYALFSNIQIYKKSRQEEVKKLTKNRDIKTLSSLYQPSQTGYNFNGWYRNESLSGNALTLAEAQAITSGITVYSKWTAKTPTVTFDAQGGSVNPTTQPVTYGNPYGALPTPTRTGYRFNGWKYKNNFITSSTIVTTETNHTLIADWSVNQYTVTFISDGNIISTTNINYGDKYSNFPTVNKEGYAFNGWKNANGATITSNSDMLIAGHHSLTAEWLPFSYTIIFNGNGDDGTGAMTSQSFKYQQEQRLTKNTFSKPNHKFIGWNTAIDGTGDSFSDEHQMKDFKPNSDGQIITLYAQWLFSAIQNIKIDDLKVVGALLDTTKIIKIFIDKVLVYGS